MTEVQALLSGLVVGGLARAKAEGYSTLEIEPQADEQGNYLPGILASLHGERYLITVAPMPPETGHYLVIHLDGEVALLHPVAEPANTTCALSQAYLAGELPVLDHGPGRYAVWREIPDLGDLDDSPPPRWYLDPLPGEPVVSSEQLVRSFPIPLPVTLVSMPRSGETYVLQDRWGWFWMVPPDGAGEPEHITEAVAQESIRKADWELVGQSFSTWERLHWFRQGRAATLAPARDDIPADHLVAVAGDGAVEIQHPKSCTGRRPDCILLVAGPTSMLHLPPGKYRFYTLRGGEWVWEREEAVRGEVANG